MEEGGSKGEVVNLDLMLDEYYEARGWDKGSGFPTRQKLEQLGLKAAADELQSMGKLAWLGMKISKGWQLLLVGGQ